MLAKQSCFYSHVRIGWLQWQNMVQSTVSSSEYMEQKNLNKGTTENRMFSINKTQRINLAAIPWLKSCCYVKPCPMEHIAWHKNSWENQMFMKNLLTEWLAVFFPPSLYKENHFQQIKINVTPHFAFWRDVHSYWFKFISWRYNFNYVWSRRDIMNHKASICPDKI